MKPQDILVALGIQIGLSSLSYARLSEALGLSASETHAALRRLQDSGLVTQKDRRLRTQLFFNFIRHGLPHVFPVKPGPLGRGVPTAWAAPVMEGHVAAGSDALPVWPCPNGPQRGVSIKPLYGSVPEVALANRDLYDLLALIDAIRVGRLRVRNVALELLKARLVAGAEEPPESEA